MIVRAIEHRWLDIANQVFEERTDDNVYDLANLQVHSASQCCSRMEHLELLTASDVLLGRLLENLV